MKTFFGFALIIAGVLGLIGFVVLDVRAGYQWESEIYSNWQLSDKSSTLEAKADYIGQFIVALKSGNMGDHDALIYKTANNSCENNLKAVETLKGRLDEIKGMDTTSFQYQQAIQQITEQEQGEAHNLIGTLNGCWMKANHYFLWNPFFISIFILGFILILPGIGIIILSSY